MGRTLEKVSKSFDTLHKKIDDSTDKLRKVSTNFWQHNDMVYDGIAMLEERITGLRNGGMQGENVADFMGDADVASFVEGLETCKTSCRTESDLYHAELDNLARLKQELDELKALTLKASNSKLKSKKSKEKLSDIAGKMATFSADTDAVLQLPRPHPSTHPLYR